jgi:hypothetical protein
MKSIKLTILTVLLGLFSGCASTGTVRDALAEDNGAVFIVENRSFDEVYNAALKVMSNKFSLREQDKNQGMILAENSATAFSWGERIGVQVKPHSGQKIKIVVVSQKVSRMQMTGSDWEQSVMAGIKAELGV